MATVDCSMPQLCSTVQWVHLAYGRSSTRNRPRPSALPNRRNVCIYQRLCALPVKAFGVVPSVNSECVHLSHGIQQPQPSGRGPVHRDTLSPCIQRAAVRSKRRRKKERKKKKRKKKEKEIVPTEGELDLSAAKSPASQYEIRNTLSDSRDA
ncbi:hypothetical protein HN011_006658 [Eciton burchellii]|nr:hypothetical protein HN011_006658 [Eciton burchellii]